MVRCSQCVYGLMGPNVRTGMRLCDNPSSEHYGKQNRAGPQIKCSAFIREPTMEEIAAHDKGAT